MYNVNHTTFVVPIVSCILSSAHKHSVSNIVLNVMTIALVSHVRCRVVQCLNLSSIDESPRRGFSGR